jgi:dihydrofolate reductase
MNKPRISIIAIVGKNLELGKKNQLLWHLPEDLQYFKKTTLGHPVIMGLKTFESVGGKPFPGRTNIILSFEKIEVHGCKVATSLDEALEIAKADQTDEIFICGGASIYKQMIDKSDRLYLTNVDKGDDEADVFFPDYSAFQLVENRGGGEHNGIKYQFNIYEG